MTFIFKVVHFSDVFDSTMTTQFHQEIESIVEAGVNIVLLDLKNITFINSSGLMVLVVFRVVRTAGYKLVICSMNEQFRMLFELTGVEQVFETFANLKESSLCCPEWNIRVPSCSDRTGFVSTARGNLHLTNRGDSVVPATSPTGLI